ncbi:Tropinone reductase-like protein [Colletotrichum higginsianum]|uniref:Tropinone reductase-like protein n=1 Tax=Colletotrichum higginsianum TaxID=80884 RepID=A0A4T0WBB1_9PEZI|nr:Tropinone reductase-like protein [Colletotrichum higginsianum]
MSPKYITKLEDKFVVVIGGTSGIGFAVAEASVEFGARVVVASRSQERVDDAVKKLVTSYPDAGNRIRGHVVNLYGNESEASITGLFESITDGGRDQVDHVVETAGESIGSLTLPEVTPQRIAEATSSRVTGSVMLAKVVGNYLKKAHTSSLTFTGGALAEKPPPGMSVMASIGGAKNSLTRGLAVDLSPVRVNLVAPGAVQTAVLDSFFESMGLEKGSAGFEAAKTMLKNASVSGRIGDPEDVAEAYLSLMRNHFVTGTILDVNGGMFLK